MTIRALIVDDEPHARRWIQKQVREHAEIEILAECADGFEGAAAIERLAPDLVFLDVQMPGLDGFGVLEALGDRSLPLVIFVTAFDQYAVKAFQVHALDYVLKPFGKERLFAAIERARTQLQRRSLESLPDRLETLFRELRKQGRYPKWLLVKAGENQRFVKVKDIDRVESARNYLRIHVRGESYSLRASLSEFEERLDPDQFLRIHRGTIVNIERIALVHPWARGEVTLSLTDGSRLPIGASYWAKLKGFARFGGGS